MRTCLFLLSLSTLLMNHASSHALETVKVGVVLRSVPELNSFAESLRNGITLAANVFNTKTDETLKIELVPYSHQSGHDSVSAAGKKLIEDHVSYVLGGEMSDDAFALAEEFQNKNILFMTATASVPHLTELHPMVFRACSADDQVAVDLAKYVSTLKNVNHVGVIHNTLNAYTDSATTAFSENYIRFSEKQKRMTTVKEFSFASESPNFATAVGEFKAARIDLVVAFTLLESLKLFFTSATKIGLNPVYLGSDGWGTNQNAYHQMVETQPSKKFVGLRSEYWNPNAKFPAVSKFKDAFQKEFHHAPDGWSAIAYDSALVMFQAVAKAKNKKDVNEVAALIKNGTFHDTVTAATLKYNSKNSPEKPLYLYQINSAGFKLLETLK